ncbi:MAG: radical SAM protein [Gemmataceae bacterium]
MALLACWLPLDAGGEYSIEANPANLDEDKIRVLAEHGITRVSLGSQSFDRKVLRVLDRDHSPDDVPRAVERVRRRIDTVSLDLIFGAPGQTLDQWRGDLRRALAPRLSTSPHTASPTRQAPHFGNGRIAARCTR